ncbi:MULTISPECIES: Rossmann-like and DUF2520 domain-containing protein [unclassified Algibacter]|uniref:Rossmann-like and DUF2520 domain-containing protein n=1 Tax=unclassified Algibacter TaxID=2615009 RepID=UPI00131D7B41|nr:MULTISPECIES: DUF2520 domain-containing protein [unclassified Algibacter]MCL5128451.1 DUF2520 domain-containing protein [Algibacter sp. L4_22]
MISVVILGAGNVASHLYRGFREADNVTVSQWYNRSLDSISEHSNEVDITDDLTNLKLADVYILAVSDDAIGALSEQLPFEDRVVVHTSGGVGVYDLDKKHRRGVLYPLQSFTKGAELDFADVPICIETIDKKSFPMLKELALSLGGPIQKVNSDQRRVLHLAAVFVNNFTNQLYRIGHEITESEGAEFDILKPLILETAKKIEHLSPFRAQTGPAIRRDKKTIKKHLRILDNNIEHKKIYELLTSSIQKTHGRKKL